MSAWLAWLTAIAVLIVLPVALRLLADDDPHNEQCQEQGDGKREPEPADLRLAA